MELQSSQFRHTNQPPNFPFPFSSAGGPACVPPYQSHRRECRCRHVRIAQPALQRFAGSSGLRHVGGRSRISLRKRIACICAPSQDFKMVLHFVCDFRGPNLWCPCRRGRGLASPFPPCAIALAEGTTRPRGARSRDEESEGVDGPNKSGHDVFGGWGHAKARRR